MGKEQDLMDKLMDCGLGICYAIMLSIVAALFIFALVGFAIALDWLENL